MGHELLVILGGVPGTMNLLWGGFLSCLSEFAIPVTALGMYHKHNCHKKRCPRIGKHIVDGTPWCNKHHEEARKDANTKGD